MYIFLFRLFLMCFRTVFGKVVINGFFFFCFFMNWHFIHVFRLPTAGKTNLGCFFLFQNGAIYTYFFRISKRCQLYTFLEFNFFQKNENKTNNTHQSVFEQTPIPFQFFRSFGQPGYENKSKPFKLYIKKINFTLSVSQSWDLIF